METLRDRNVGRFCVVLAVVLALVAMTPKFFTALDDPMMVLSTADNDSKMRFLSVKHWLEGQSWFDMQNYRVLPPEGIDLHWSRYVDAGIAGLAVFFGLFQNETEALLSATIFWPLLLQLCFLSVVGFTAWRVFGPFAAVFSVLAVVANRYTGSFHFNPGRIDHHGLQILLVSIVVSAMIVPGSERRRGIIAGSAAAFSLAVGLEMLLLIALAGLILIFRTYRDPSHSSQKLRVFGVTLLLCSIVLHIGQTAPQDWLLPQCDELGPQIILLAAVGCGLAFVVPLIAMRPESTSNRLFYLSLALLLSIIIAFAVVRSCPGGPYGNLSPELRAEIERQIVEAKSFFRFLSAFGAKGVITYTSVLIATIGLSLMLLYRYRVKGVFDASDRAILVLLAFSVFGVFGVYYQWRMWTLTLPVAPLLVGVFVATIFQAVLRAVGRNKPIYGLFFLASLIVCLLPQQINDTTTSFVRAYDAPPPQTATTDTPRRSCRHPEVLATLNALPPARVLASDAISSSTLLITHHNILAAPYHRSSEAFFFTLVTLQEGEETLRTSLDRGNVDYLVLCRRASAGVDDRFRYQLAAGAEVPWLTELEGFDPALRVYQVD